MRDFTVKNCTMFSTLAYSSLVINFFNFVDHRNYVANLHARRYKLSRFLCTFFFTDDIQSGPLVKLGFCCVFRWITLEKKRVSAIKKQKWTEFQKYRTRIFHFEVTCLLLSRIIMNIKVMSPTLVCWLGYIDIPYSFFWYFPLLFVVVATYLFAI